MRALSILFLCTVSLSTYGQQKGYISGKIVDKNSVPISEVHLVVLNAQTGTTSDQDGLFVVNSKAGPAKLKISTLSESRTLEVNIPKDDTLKLGNIRLDGKAIDLFDVVVTGQSEPQSLKQSVYQVRTIDSERIKARGATSLQSILNTELGIRFSNDMTLGTSDIQLMGMNGQNVKILLDGIPMVDRGSTRESLGQIDVNTIERIEIVEGPMSVIYGSDALAGVINIITKKGSSGENLTVSARLQEETVNKEYDPFKDKGMHNESVGVTWQHSGLQVSGNVTRNNFGGWTGNSTGRSKQWMPKDQMLYAASTGYRNNKFNIWYRFNGTDETIKYLGDRNAITKIASDKDYITKRWFHQIQSEYKASEKLNFTGVLSYTDYSRKTLSTNVDANDRRTLSLDAGAQDKSIFTTTFFRGTALYKFSTNFTVLGGVDLTNNQASGARISGSPTITESAIFLAPQISIGERIKLSPGLRFLHNSVYDAPPVIPSFNGKVILLKNLDLRFGYARGFRSPALRELYFDFHDASHSINGNVNLKAEYSNSFNSFLVWQSVKKETLRVSTTFGGFYNVFHNLIDTAIDPNNTSQTTYLNVHLFKTTGFTLDNKFNLPNMQASVGGSYIGRYNEFSEAPAEYGSLPQFVWSPEINANLLYTFSKLGASINLFYKYTGQRTVYESLDQATVNLAKVEAFHTADLTISKTLGRYVNLLAGVKNLFDVTNLTNTSQDTGGAHSTGGSVSTMYGRSYFLGLNVQWSKN